MEARGGGGVYVCVQNVGVSRPPAANTEGQLRPQEDWPGWKKSPRIWRTPKIQRGSFEQAWGARLLTTQRLVPKQIWTREMLFLSQALFFLTHDRSF